MLNTIEKIQKKPPHIRRNIAFLGAFLGTFIAVFLWFSNADFYFSEKEEVNKVEGESPFSLIKKELSSLGTIVEDYTDAFPEQIGE